MIDNVIIVFNNLRWISTAQAALDKNIFWCCSRCLKKNTVVMVNKSQPRINHRDIRLLIEGSQVEKVGVYKYPGIIVDRIYRSGNVRYRCTLYSVLEHQSPGHLVSLKGLTTYEICSSVCMDKARLSGMSFVRIQLFTRLFNFRCDLQIELESLNAASDLASNHGLPAA